MLCNQQWLFKHHTGKESIITINKLNPKDETMWVGIEYTDGHEDMFNLMWVGFSYSYDEGHIIRWKAICPIKQLTKHNLL